MDIMIYVISNSTCQVMTEHKMNIKIRQEESKLKRKDQAITFRATEDEYKMIKEKAKSLNLTVTDFIVKCCQEKEVKNK